MSTRLIQLESSVPILVQFQGCCRVAIVMIILVYIEHRVVASRVNKHCSNQTENGINLSIVWWTMNFPESLDHWSNYDERTYAENRPFETDSFPPIGYSWVQHQQEQTNHLGLQLWTQSHQLSASAARDSGAPTHVMPFSGDLMWEWNQPLEREQMGSQNGGFLSWK